jgi:hypothetical protein
MTPLEAARALLVDDGGNLDGDHYFCRDCGSHVCHMLIRQAGDCEVTEPHRPTCMYGVLPRIVAALEAAERLTAWPHEAEPTEEHGTDRIYVFCRGNGVHGPECRYQSLVAALRGEEVRE